MKRILLYDWNDKAKARVLREVAVQAEEPLTRNGKERIYIWTAGDESNLLLYPQYGTAYVENEERLQRQRNSKVFLYSEVQ